MNRSLRRLIDTHGGAITWAAACASVPEGVVEWASRTRQIRLPFPGVLIDPDRPYDDQLRYRAALLCAGLGAALSHTSALAMWRLPAGGEDVHVMTGPQRRIRVPGIVGHRRRGFVAAPPTVLTRAGLPVTGLERSLVDGWPLLSGDAQRAPVLVAVGERVTTPARVRDALATVPNLPQRSRLSELLDRMTAGCRSALELWGYDHVFCGPGFERLAWQVPVTVGTRTFWLDAYDEDSATNFELDGTKYHGSPRNRERDLRRDAKLATLGIQAVRFTHHRLNYEIEGVRNEALTIMQIRRSAGFGRAA